MAEYDLNATNATAPRRRNPLELTIVLLIEVFVFMLALYGVARIDAGETTQVVQQISYAKLAVRQEALLDRVIADLAQIVSARRAAERSDRSADMAAALGTLGDTQAALRHGGTTTDLSGKAFQVAKLSAAPEQALLGQIDPQLSALRAQLAPLTAAQTLAPAGKGRKARTQARAAAAQARAAIVSAAALRDPLARLAADVAQENPVPYGQTRLRLYGLAIFMMLVILGTLFRRVNVTIRQIERYASDLAQRSEEAEDANRRLAEAKASTDLIMETVDRGLFLIRADNTIDGQYSRELEQIFRRENLDGHNFLNVLQGLLTERVLEISRDYLGLLFDTKRKERTVLRVNPLAEVEVHFPNPAGGFDSKFLNFSFRRIIENGEVARVFVSVSDITERVRLERELRESEAKKERQFEFLLGVLHVEPKSLDDFLATANDQLVVMNDALRASDFATPGGNRMDLLRQRLDVVYRAVHTIKGNASMLQLTYFQRICDGFETKIVALRERRTLSGDDFLSIVIAQSELRQDVNELRDLRERFVADARPEVVAREVLAGAHTTEPDIAAGITSLANQIGERTGKLVRVDAGNFSTEGLPDDLRRAVKDVLIQLTRNAVMHGVEVPDDRQIFHKPDVATLTIKSKMNGGSFVFSFRDDGRGLDPTYLREKAVANKVISPKAAAAMNDRQLVGLIFRSGFSTLDESTTDAGRGVGMNVVKEIVVDRLGGRLTLNSDPHKFTEFRFEVPLVTPDPAGPGRVAELAYN